MIADNIIDNVVKIIKERQQKKQDVFPQLQDELEIEIRRGNEIINQEIYK